MNINNFLNEEGNVNSPVINDLPTFDQYLVEKHILETGHLDEKQLSPYQKFFQSKLNKWGVKSPADLKGSEKGKFFREIKAEWKKGGK